MGVKWTVKLYKEFWFVSINFILWSQLANLRLYTLYTGEKYHSFMALTRKITPTLSAPWQTNSTPSSSNVAIWNFTLYDDLQSPICSCQMPPNFNLVFNRGFYCPGWQNHRTRIPHPSYKKLPRSVTSNT